MAKKKLKGEPDFLSFRPDPAVERFKAIKALLVKRGHSPSLHAKDCICLCCIEGKLKAIIPVRK